MMNMMKLNYVAVILPALLAAAMPLSAADYDWDADLLTPGAQDGDGTWTVAGTVFWDGSAGADVVAPVPGSHNLNFGKSSGGHTVTIDNNGVLLEYATASAANVLNVYNNYTFAAATVGDGLLIGNLTVNNSSVATISAAISSAGGLKNWDASGGSTLNLSGGGVLQRLRGNNDAAAGMAAVNITGGAWGTGPGGYMIGGGNANVRVEQSGGTVTITDNAFFIQAGNGVTSEYVLNGGVLEINGKHFNVGAGASSGPGQVAFTVQSGTLVNSGGGVGFRIGNDNGSGIFNVAGGVVSVTNSVIIVNRMASGNGTTPTVGEFNVSGGVTKFSGIQFGEQRTGNQADWAPDSKGTFNLTGGEVYLGGGGIYVSYGTANAGYQVPVTEINLGNGTLGALNLNWSSTLAMNLTGAGGGNVKFKAANDEGVSRNITLNGALSGSGGLEKTGGGTLLLGAANTYTGATVVSAGTLNAAVAQALGLGGDVSVLNGGILRLGDAAAISDLSSLYLFTGAQVNLDFTGTAEIGSLFFNSVLIDSLVVGQSYTAGELNAALGGVNIFGGSGLLDISVIPEPSAWLLLGVGVLLMVAKSSSRKGREEGRKGR